MTTLVPGRVIFMNIPWHDDSKISVLAVYSLNALKDIKDFWKSITDQTSTNPQLKPNVVLGDFNLVEDAIDRIPCRQDDHQATENLRDFRSKFNLINGWRKANPDEKGYSWLRELDGTQSRIDRIYINKKFFDSCGEWKIEPAPIPTDHDLVSARISSPTAPKIGRGRWAIPTRLIKNRTIKAEIQKLGCELERRMGNITLNDLNQNNPQVLLRDFKTRVREMVRCHEKRIQPMIKMKIVKLSEKLSQITNNPTSHLMRSKYSPPKSNKKRKSNA